MSGHRLSPAAAADLDDIWTWTEATFGPAQAERYVRLIQQRIEDVASGRLPSRSAEQVRTGYRKVTSGSQVVYFRRASDEVLDVMRILRQSMDAEARL